MLAGVVSIEANQNPPQSDIRGGAALIFKRPENPTTRDREAATANKQRSARDDTSDKVDDAIALGNAARDRRPPDFESAEKAYRLAWKLNPSDPRPYLGLGNLYWDQRRYTEAAQSYRDALRYIDRTSSSRSLLARVSGGGLGTARISKTEISALDSDTQTRIYFAATLLQEQNPVGAEKELRLVAFTGSNNPEWNSLFGYALSAQGRYTEAVGAYEKAVKLEPLNEKYKELLRQATEKARAASANDQSITTRLQNTTWEIRDATSSRIKGTCQLEASGSVRCKSAGSSLALLQGRWRIRDGIFGFEDVFKVPFCIGQLRATTIAVKCYMKDSETDDLWMKLQR